MHRYQDGTQAGVSNGELSLDAHSGKPSAPDLQSVVSAKRCNLFFKLMLLVPVLFISQRLSASPIGIATVAGFLHDSTGLLTVYDTGAANFFSTLDSNNLGTFGFSYTNTGVVAQTNVRFFGFLDADIDRASNTALNEYGNVIAQTLPPGASKDALQWTSFQIDEPGFTTGTIIDSLLNGYLDNTNHVPPGMGNDVSLALGIPIGILLPGQSFTATFVISDSNIGGLSQTDPDSNYTFYLNGYSTNPAASPIAPVSANTPEPPTGVLLLLPVLGLLFLVMRRRSSLAAAMFLLVFSVASLKAQLQLNPQAAAQGYKLTLFADGFPSLAGAGPVGIAFPDSGGVLVTDYPGHVRVFPTDSDGQHASDVTPALNLGIYSGAGAVKSGGHIFIGDQGDGSVRQLNDDGTQNQIIIAGGLGDNAGLATNPQNGHIFTSGRGSINAIFDIDPVAKALTVFVGGILADGLTFSADGSVLYSARYDIGHIIGYANPGGAQVFDSGAINSLDGCALGTGALVGYLFVNTNDGRLVQVNLANSSQTVLASGGSRGDLVTVDPTNGSLLITQTDSIYRLTAPAGAGFGGTTPIISNLIARFKDASADLVWTPPILPQVQALPVTTFTAGTARCLLHSSSPAYQASTTPTPDSAMAQAIITSSDG